MIERMLAVSVNIQKYAMYIYSLTLRTLCVNSSITVKSHAAISTPSC